ncbi:unnamed protein product [Caenorhabditis nigoni]
MRLLFLLLLFSISSSAIDSAPSDLHIVKSKTFEFSDVRELLEWDLDLRDIASYAKKNHEIIKMEVNSNQPITFQMLLCSDHVMGKVVPFKKTVVYLDGPWLEMFAKENKCSDGSEEIVMKLEVDEKPAFGFFKFSAESNFSPRLHPFNQTRFINLDIVGSRSHWVSMEDFFVKVHQSPSAIIFLSTASSTIPISFSKCGMDGLMFKLTREVPLVVDDYLLSHFELMAFLYCTQNDYQYVLELTAITPANHTSGSILIELEALNNHLDTLTLRIFSVLFVFLIIALTVFLAIIIHKCHQERRQEKRALSTLDAANDIEMVTLTDGPADE